MSDSPCGFSTDQFLATLDKYGPELSAHEIASLAKVSIRQVLCCVHHDDWTIQAFSGPKGWLYRKRPVMGATVRPPKEVGEYNDSAITKSGPRGHVCDRVK